MKGLIKKILLICCVILLFGLSACNNGGLEKETYPHFEYYNSSFNFDKYNQVINLEKGYLLDQGHAYDILDTEIGYDIVFHIKQIKE